ncbi:hypothetical protein D9619_009925 [Psilocybe cf. subviscida]|uniref:Uncharacterized protein n=1 Tax=Psilocybe cf. subviscida TaxID=2480587 RepID=A0A8H5BKK3_9AGAR|nr:hypothetical protein D9619_009925 [Psilocybe cf. subviscida]
MGGKKGGSVDRETDGSDCQPHPSSLHSRPLAHHHIFALSIHSRLDSTLPAPSFTVADAFNSPFFPINAPSPSPQAPSIVSFHLATVIAIAITLTLCPCLALVRSPHLHLRGFDLTVRLPAPSRSLRLHIARGRCGRRTT